MSEAPDRVLSVELSQDALLFEHDRSDRVVLKHRVDPQGCLQIVTARDGEVCEEPLHAVLSRVSAEHRLASPYLAPDRYSELLHWLPERKRQTGLDRQRHVLDVLQGRVGTGSGYDAATTSVAKRRAAKCAELGVDATTLGRWIEKWRAGGAFALVPHASRYLQPSRANETDPQILAVVRDYVAQRHQSSKKSLINEHGIVLNRLRQLGLVSAGTATPGPDGTTIPHEITALPYERFVALVRYLSRGQDPLTGKTRQEQSNRPLIHGVRHRSFELGDRVEYDASRTDMLVWGPHGPQQLWAVFGVCVSTRYAWLRLTVGPPRGIHLSLLLWDMIGGEAWATMSSPPPHAALPVVPGALDVHAWNGPNPPLSVLPGSIGADHGAEEENGHFIATCAQLGITIQWARTMRPTDKAFVESHIKTFAQACQLLPGHKGNTVVNKPARLDVRDLPTFAQAQAAFATWSWWTAQQPHTGLTHDHAPQRHLTPIEAVGLSLTRGVPAHVLADPTFHLRLLPHLSLTPHDDGVTWQKRRYTCENYEDLVQASLTNQGRRRPLTFFYDPDAPSRLLWQEPHSFKVRTLWAPGANGAVVGAFAEVRSALLKNLAGQKWPSHNEHASRRADLLQTITAVYQAQGIDTGENFIPVADRRSRKPNRPKEPEHIVNGGWDLAHFTALDHGLLDDLDPAHDAEGGWRP
ncbi:hypothetical protein [Nocardioides campestrisoli]|uniref:hypothetical protein n=1 Tax=Nocardioides campestrisoli TaxID=2736757 RepID=UPI00163D88FC|nr:hypothetical protein [Nocardioides campestrisoli]